MTILHVTTAAVVLSFFISPIWAAQCGTTLTLNASELHIISPDDLKNQTQNCNLDNTRLYIKPEFVGAFSLNGISNVSSVELDRYGSQARNFDFPVTSIDLNETTYMKRLSVTRARGLKSVSAPKLEYVYDLEIAGNTTELLDFPALKNVTTMHLYDNFSRINFPLLRNISWALSYGPLDIPTGDTPPFQADFPSLESAGAIGIFGTISSWNTPKLRSIKPSNPNDTDTKEAKLSIDHKGEPLALDFPTLSEVTTIRLSGNLSSVSFPALQEVKKINIFPSDSPGVYPNSTPVTVDLSSLRTVESLSISGNVTSLSLDSLTNFTTLYVRSSSPLNCTPLFELYERVRHEKFDPDSTISGFACFDSIEGVRLSEKYSPKKNGLAKGTIAGITVGVTVFVFFAIGIWYARYRSKKSHVTAERRVADEHELRQKDSISIKNPAPPYHEAVRP